MNKWVVIPIIIILTIGTITNGYFYMQESDKLEEAQSEIAALEVNVSALEGNLSTLKGDVSALEGNALTLEGDVLTLEGDVSTLEEGISALGAYDRAVIDVVAILEPSVVRIEALVQGVYGGIGSGSGVIISSDGYVLTNNHVVEGATSVEITLMSGGRYDATVVASDEDRDLAILEIISNRTDFPEAVLGSSENLLIGEDVVVAGYPYGYYLEGRATFTKGIVSAFRTVDDYDWVQYDAPMNLGNSGGPLVNLKGEVIGINTWGFDYEGVNFAIPIDEAKLFIQDNIG